LSAYYEYYNNLSPYSTQHGIKGAEFDNVLVILDNGKWNKYNFQHYFEKTPGKESIIERTKKLFYVCCSRAKNNLVVYTYKPSESFVNSSKLIFGNENVHKI
jgi:DNA helicase-2/ATP-dependent DNA helicase PcrA